jgi:TonB family protein
VSKSALQQAPAEAFPITVRPANDARPSESLVALTHDDLLKETLTDVAPEHVLSFATDEADLTHHLHEEPAGVAFLDSAALSASAAQLTERLRERFPDLVLIVAGGPEDQAALSHQVTNGTVYRFLHKPVSAQRVKLFVDAAWRRHDVEHAATGTFAALKLESPLKRRLARHWAWLALAALAVVVAGAMALVLRDTRAGHFATPATAPASASAAAAITPLLARADAALARGALSAPPSENAADLYRQVLGLDPANVRARQGLQRVGDGLVTSAEQALLADHLDQAQELTAAARAIDPGNVRIGFLAAAIAKESSSQRALDAGAATPAKARSSRAHGGSPASGAQASTRSEPGDVADRVSGFLKQADARMRSGALVAPAGNNAQFFVDAAVALAPDDPGVLKTQRTLAERLLAEAQSAGAAGDVVAGERWAQAASDAGASSEQLVAVRHSLQSARAAASAGTLARLAELFNQRLTQGQLLTPATDSARFYLAQLESADPTSPSTVLARTSLAQRLLDQAHRSVTGGDWAAAEDWLTEARVVGVSASDASATEQAIAAARRNSSENTVLPEVSLKRLRYVAPAYPPVAEQLGRSGSVEMQFTVKPDGSVADIKVTHAEPQGMFDAAAVAAVRNWHYQPIERDGRPVSQRVTVRVNFKPESP